MSCCAHYAHHAHHDIVALARTESCPCHPTSPTCGYVTGYTLDKLDHNAVLGVFTYQPNANQSALGEQEAASLADSRENVPPFNNEIDFELAK